MTDDTGLPVKWRQSAGAPSEMMTGVHWLPAKRPWVTQGSSPSPAKRTPPAQARAQPGPTTVWLRKGWRFTDFQVQDQTSCQKRASGDDTAPGSDRGETDKAQNTKVSYLRLPRSSSDKESCPAQLFQGPWCSPPKRHWEFSAYPESHSASTQPTEISWASRSWGTLPGALKRLEGSLVQCLRTQAGGNVGGG